MQRNLHVGEILKNILRRNLHPLRLDLYITYELHTYQVSINSIKNYEILLEIEYFKWTKSGR